MLRIILIAAVLYFLYRILKGIFVQKTREVRGSGGQIIDELVQDPQCKLYIPSRTSVKRVITGRDYSFCSEECANRFQQSKEARQ
jgi:YHS domain-containing protein